MIIAVRSDDPQIRSLEDVPYIIDAGDRIRGFSLCLLMKINRGTPPGSRDQGFRSTGIGGSSRIRVMVTRRFGDIEGLSGNNGSVSALPATM